MTPDATSLVLQGLLVGLVLPVWLLSGLADWSLHKALRIEHTAGPVESAMHLAMLGQLGLGVVLAAACEPTAGVLATLLALCVVHEVTLVVDLVYAMRRRRIPVAEQWVHALQQALPWVAFGLYAIVHRHVVLPDGAPHAPAWASGFALRRDPLPAGVWALVAGGGAVLTVAYLGEWFRAVRGRRASHPVPQPLQPGDPR